MNYTDRGTPWTRISGLSLVEMNEEDRDVKKTVISKDNSSKWNPEDEPYSSNNDEKKCVLYLKYKELAEKKGNYIFG